MIVKLSILQDRQVVEPSFSPLPFFILLYQDEYSPVNAQHAIGIHGYVLVYSITSRKSFEMIQIVYDKIVDFCGVEDIPCVIVGSKCDLNHRFGQLMSFYLDRGN